MYITFLVIVWALWLSTAIILFDSNEDHMPIHLYPLYKILIAEPSLTQLGKYIISTLYAVWWIVLLPLIILNTACGLIFIKFPLWVISKMYK